MNINYLAPSISLDSLVNLLFWGFALFVALSFIALVVKATKL